MHVILMYRTHLSFSAVVQNFLRCPVKLSKALILSSLTELRERGGREREGGRERRREREEGRERRGERGGEREEGR